MTNSQTVFVVDDDDAVRDSLRALLESAGFAVEDYGSPRKFLEQLKPGRTGCLIADIRMPEMDGLELQQELARRKACLSVIIVTGHGDVPLAVRAMKAGAVEFIEKPFDDTLMVEGVQRALDLAAAEQSDTAAQRVAQERIAELTERERQVLAQLVAGRPNKVIAFKLDISPRTVEVHRAHVMDKLNVRSLSELVRLSLAAGVQGATD